MPKKPMTKKIRRVLSEVEVGAWGIVVALRGKYAGEVGYYDDDADQPGYCVVYFGEPFVARWAEVSRKSLRIATPTEIRGYRKAYGMRDLTAAHRLGVPEDAKAD